MLRKKNSKEVYRRFQIFLTNKFMYKITFSKILYFVKKITIFLLFHISVFLMLIYLFNVISGLFFTNASYVKILRDSYLIFVDDSGDGNILLFVWGITYYVFFIIYELITDSYKYFTTRKFIFLQKIIIILGVSVILSWYLVWFIRNI